MSLQAIDNLILQLKKLPGVGYKSAERMAYQIIKFSKSDITSFIDALKDCRDNITSCPKCLCYKEGDKCLFCEDKTRDKDTLIVLSSFQDVLSFERVSSHFSYQLLNGVISPSKGISIKDLAIDKLMDRIKEDNFKEVILGLNPDLDGETTSLYLEKVLHEEFPNLKISRLAYGLPMGGNLSYVDDLTLQKAIEGRKIVNE